MPFPRHGSRKARKHAVAKRLSAGLCLLALGAQPAVPQEDPWARPTLNFMGVPGILDMPAAHPMGDADLSFSVGVLERTRRGTLHFQITPRLSGVFRYVNLEDYDQARYQYYDRSFDLIYQLAEEGRRMPAVTVGLQDFGGTGIYAGEYVVATKTFGRLRATGGIGWGRFGSYNGFSNPLGFLSDTLDDRPEPESGIGQTGKLDTEHWFRGDAAFFGGLQYAVNDRLVLSAEYSSDAYESESDRMDFDRASPFNFGATYRIQDHFDVSAAWLYGSTFAVGLRYTFNPKTPTEYPGGLDQAPRAVQVRAPGSAADLGWTQQAGATQILRGDMQSFLAADGMVLESFTVDARIARTSVRTGTQVYPAQAVGRTARIMTQLMPASVERFEITLVTPGGMPVSTVTVNRSDLEELEHAPDGSWQSFARARIEDSGPGTATGIPEGAFPRYDWSFGPYLSAAYFDPENPLRLAFGLQLNGSYEPLPGLVFQGSLLKSLAENISDLPPSNSRLQHVRSDANLYAEEADFTVANLTATKYFRPGEDLFGRVTAGYFEPMFGGLSGEILWKPADSRLGLGLEVNYAKQREYDQGLGFLDYDVVTGHASAYYDAPGDFHYQVDVGRYLAEDWGATIGIDREFDNGIRIGAFATFTDVSFDDFGEGSFDKGVRFHIPLSALTGSRTDLSITRTLRPIQRDGGARLEMNTRLYEQVRAYQQPELQNEWGRFWR
ncbi:YjbH domain-containing protein [Salipiger thiooxidans]|mgnify:CR=1 FL=1|uniref:YjbH domain-containing protein n=1 Tax=Salipiger thiooxidans TaxID=282683 RepID=UPI001A9076D1|nr:YjbH domain-containing protein [Salipiger thiooxidans]MBN8189834.1 YjbH domain-containing protein [Salipiger thiooxidans]